MGLGSETIGGTLCRDGARLAEALGLAYPEGYREAHGLLAHVMALSPAQISSRSREALKTDLRDAYERLIERRRNGEPYAYVVGRREFYGLDFWVTPAVLIPRPETELLVETALARVRPDQPATILDLGTGSGVLAITMSRLRPRAEVTAVDASAAALQVALDNAARLRADRVRFRESDWYSALGNEQFDLILSNPPYVAAHDPHLGRGDLRFEPRHALVAGKDGLDGIRSLVRGAPCHLIPGGWLCFEHGHDQAAACRQLLERALFERVSTLKDLGGMERVTGGQMARVDPDQPSPYHFPIFSIDH